MPIFLRRRGSALEPQNTVPALPLLPEVKFYKYVISGNDYIIINNMDGHWDQYVSDSAIVGRMLDRRYGIGADSLIELKARPGKTFELVCYGPHGKFQTFSGNGACCAVHVAKKLNLLIYNEAIFISCGSQYLGVFDEINNAIHIKIKDGVETTQIDSDNYFASPGSPHHIRFVHDLENCNVLEEGRKVAHTYSETELGVDFVEIDSNGRIHARFYDKTLNREKQSCGTGTLAVILGLVSREEWDQELHKSTIYPPPQKHVYMKGGRAATVFSRLGPNSFYDVILIGKTNLVFEGFYPVKDQMSDIGQSEHKMHEHIGLLS